MNDERAAAAEAAADDWTPPPDVETVEALVRRQLSHALGGRRGMLEAGIPGITFTAVWLIFSELQWALVASLAVALVALVVRLVQRSTLQYVLNALFAIGIGWVFVRIAASSGGSETDQALAFFLPGILYSLGYSIVLALSCLTRWPVVGFMIGAATEDPLGWRRNPQVVKLCTRLTWVLMAPGAIGVLLQGPVWLLGYGGTIDAETAVLVIVILRMGLGWVIRIASFATMIWLLARNATPLEPEPAAEQGGAGSGRV
ncbi:DUF3159 domain-containing protein [Nocardioides panacisoli]|uniref:DUF3159 domain-containing protein n=1 Tax=Nocardioides panacisoli TaxID=627624 RepID=UPI001C62CF3B|nr:DUF3159 domain-containing protein [Nocardioides panacisoli]QYJ04816.1 DUF3159 domain-containing protein [Nocardioides panacisoli]